MTSADTTIVQRFSFEAAHHLPWHQGRCKNVHGHGYRLDVGIRGNLDSNGIVVDFDDVQSTVRDEVLRKYDHTNLNDRIENPTAEVLAQRILLEIIELWATRKLHGRVVFVRVWENEHSYAEATNNPTG